jgi:hemerythrin-like domain-containing protein
MLRTQNSFLTLLELHHDLDRLLATHQASFIKGNPTDAVARWHSFAAMLTEHAQDEEDHLLPVYAARVSIPAGGTVELFLAEHTKIRAFLKEIGERIDALPDSGRPEASEVIAIIEREYELKRLLEHHDMREKNFLYPLLDGCTTPEERHELLSQVRRST